MLSRNSPPTFSFGLESCSTPSLPSKSPFTKIWPSSLGNPACENFGDGSYPGSLQTVCSFENLMLLQGLIELNDYKWIVRGWKSSASRRGGLRKMSVIVCIVKGFELTARCKLLLNFRLVSVIVTEESLLPHPFRCSNYLLPRRQGASIFHTPASRGKSTI